jgi:1-acyl-sn-glycerol-3-phosphate acyltransferase
LAASGFGLFAGCVAALCAYPWLRRGWRAGRERIRSVCTCGYLPDPPTALAHRVMKWVARFVVWLQVGRIRVTGLEHLDVVGPRLITPTHGHYLDPFVLALILPGRARCMAACGLLASGGGLAALILSRWGAFCVDLADGRGGPAAAAAVRVLTSGQTLVLFPEGWAHLDGAVRPFKRGAVGISRMAAQQSGSAVPILPVRLHYGAYPGTWINRLPPPLQYVIMLVGVLAFRRGVQVVCGRPIRSSDLPADPSEATRQLRDRVLGLVVHGPVAPGLVASTARGRS